MSGLNPIKEAPKPVQESPEVSLRKNISNAVSVVCSAMQNGMLDEEQLQALSNNGIRPTQVGQTAYETLNDLLGMAQAVKAKIIDGGVVKVDDPAELAKLVNIVVKLMDTVRKSMSEARRNEELTALEASLHECLSDIQDSVSGNKELSEIVDASMKTMMRNLEDRLKQVERKYED